MVAVLLERGLSADAITLPNQTTPQNQTAPQNQTTPTNQTCVAVASLFFIPQRSEGICRFFRVCLLSSTHFNSSGAPSFALFAKGGM
jgi:hypothetical protein